MREARELPWDAAAARTTRRRGGSREPCENAETDGIVFFAPEQISQTFVSRRAPREGPLGRPPSTSVTALLALLHKRPADRHSDKSATIMPSPRLPHDQCPSVFFPPDSCAGPVLVNPPFLRKVRSRLSAVFGARGSWSPRRRARGQRLVRAPDLACAPDLLCGRDCVAADTTQLPAAAALPATPAAPAAPL